MWTTPDGYELHLPRSGLTKIMSRLNESGLGKLVRFDPATNMVDGILSSIGHLAVHSRRTKKVSHTKSNKRYLVFTGQISGGRYRILTKPLNSRQSAIMFVSYEPWKTAELNGNHELDPNHTMKHGGYHPNVLKPPDVLQREARNLYFKVNPRQIGKVVIHHRFPLTLRTSFPLSDPNRLSNLLAFPSKVCADTYQESWRLFEKAFKRRGVHPTAREIWQHVWRLDKLYEEIILTNKKRWRY